MSPNAPSKNLSADQQMVLDHLKDRSGLIFPQTRMPEILALIEKSAKAARLAPGEYARQVTNDDSMFDELCNKVTIAETYFFRDPNQFEFVKNHVIPDWKTAEMQPTDGFPLWNIWSAGCSTGEEPYSLAILFDREGLGSAVRIMATDLSKKSLALAHAANYGSWSLRTADHSFREKYFDHKDDRFLLKDKYASQVRFAHLNLVSPILPGNSLGLSNLDLIFCRNVLIYFDRESIAKVLKTFHSLLKPGGYLILGPSDPAASQFANFEVLAGPWGVFYKKGEGGVEPTSSALSQFNPSENSFSSAKSTKKHPPARKHQSAVNRLPQSKAALPPSAKPGTTEPSINDALQKAQSAFNSGQYEKAFNMTGMQLHDADAAALHIRALANFKGTESAEKILKKLLQQHLDSFQLQFLHSHLLLDLGQLEAARAALKRCLFLDPKSIMAHYTLSLIQQNLQDTSGARRSLRNVIDLCQNQVAETLVPFGEGQKVKNLASAAMQTLEKLGAE